MAIDKSTLAKEVGGKVRYLYPKTTADLVEYDETQTVDKKIKSMDTNIKSANDRISSIASGMSDGSISSKNDAELLDIRNVNPEVDTDTYTSAGDAVRGQIGKVKNLIDKSVTSVMVTELPSVKDPLQNVTDAIDAKGNEVIEIIDNKITEVNIYSGVKVSDTEPTEDAVSVWVNPNTDESFIVPEVNDKTVSEDDTWSSKKIKESIDAASNTEEINSIKSEITELKKSVSDGKSLVASAITNKGVETESDATYETMATNINNIRSGGGTGSVVLNAIIGIKDIPSISSPSYIINGSSGTTVSITSKIVTEDNGTTIDPLEVNN